MDNRPVAVFDSGLGGLTAVKQLAAILPREDIIYFGDTGRVPYGTRSDETIIKYARQDVNFLRGCDIKQIIIACGTVSSVALETLAGEYDIPMLGVIETAAERAAKSTRNGIIGIIGTQATIRSDAYARAIKGISPDIGTMSAACPLLVPLVENGRFRKGDRVTRMVLEEYLKPILDAGADTLILGCTHYPLLRDIIEDMLPGMTLIDPGAEAAREAARRLETAGLRCESTKSGSISFFVSDSTDGFAQCAEMFLGMPVKGRVSRVEIERY